MIFVTEAGLTVNVHHRVVAELSHVKVPSGSRLEESTTSVGYECNAEERAGRRICQFFALRALYVKEISS